MPVILLPLLAFPALARGPEPMTAEELASLHAEIVPAEQEKWQSIPWATSSFADGAYLEAKGQ